MKKSLAFFSIILVFLIIYLLQVNFFSWFTIAKVQPNLFIIFLMFIGIFLGKEYGVAFGTIFGVLLDLFTSNIIGINAIVLGVVGFLAGLLERNFSKEHKTTLLFITTILTFFGELIKYLLALLTTKSQIEVYLFSRILCIEIVYNILLVIIWYSIMQWYGELLKKVIKGNKKKIKYI